MDIVRKHFYKVYRDGVFLGLLRNVESYFEYSQDINTASTETYIEVSESLDTSDEEVNSIDTEASDPITTESLDELTTERSFEYIGGKDSGRLIANGNDIEVWEYSDDAVNAVKVFDGYIVRWVNEVGKNNRTTLTVISHGVDVNHTVYGNSVLQEELAQTSTNNDLCMGAQGQPARGTGLGGDAADVFAQTFTGQSIDLLAVRVKLARGTDQGGGAYPGSANCTLKLYQGTLSTKGSGTLLGSVTKSVSTLFPTFTETDFVFDSDITLSSSKTYRLEWSTDNYTSMQIQTSNVYANGAFGFWVTGTSASFLAPGYDLWFKLLSGSLLTEAEFSSYDPSDIIKDAIDYYGGRVTYDGSSIEDTGLSLTYTFSMATVLEVIRKAHSLAPSGWFWYVDPADQKLYLKETHTTPDHYFTLDKHTEAIDIETSIEDITNVVYFTGGPNPTNNLLKLYTDTDSLAINKRGLKRFNDNRVTVEATAQSISENYMEEYSDEEYLSRVVVLAEKYDIDSIKLGDVVGFNGFGNFVDNLVLQITTLRRRTDSVELVLGKLQFKSSNYIDDIKRGLELQQTLDNPSSPS